MRNKLSILMALGAAAGLATFAFADNKASSTEAKDAKWMPLDPSNPKGVQISPVFGNPGDPKATGPVIFLLKSPPGGKAPEHIHTNDYYATVVAGMPAHGDDEKSAKTHAPGSTWFEPGKHPHFDACTSKDDCILSITFPKGPVDFVPVGPDGKPLPPPKATPPAKK
jgi:quercetin dioxygenase-like cupin family protein